MLKMQGGIQLIIDRIINQLILSYDFIFHQMNKPYSHP